MPDDRTAYCVEGCGRPAETSRPLAITRDGDPITELVCYQCAGMTAEMLADDNYWFADIGDDPPKGHPWQPFLQNGGCCTPLAVWFATEEECQHFIREIPHGAGPAIITFDRSVTDEQIEQFKAEWQARQPHLNGHVVVTDPSEQPEK